MSVKKPLFAVIVLVFVVSSLSLAQKLQNLKNQPPDGAGIGFLMTDGAAIFQGNNQSDWWKLTPDIHGSYINGTWSQVASLPSGYVPLYFAAAVLADGRLVIVGGEYNSLQ
ncbi:MAG TPA: hypothetical protein VK829_02740, partial [Terriglobales bacterium]|nr:hypothetical protein [Terriglobales bacterium]